MRSRITMLVAAAVLCMGGRAPGALNGFAVTTIRTYCHSDFTLYYSRTFGHIVKFTIQDGSVVASDTLYKAHLADFPTINVTGDKIAFIRKDDGNAYKYLTVMDADGGNVHDLDTFPGYYGEGGESKFMLDWPAGDWIYYNRGSNIGGPDPLYRINVNDPSQRELIYTYSCFYAFSLSLDATRSSVTTPNCSDAQAWYCNALYAFPPTSEPRGDWPSDVSYGCGSYISPSGNHHVHFQDQGHTTLGVNTLDWQSNTASTTVDLRQNPTFAEWSGLPQDSVAGDKMWYPRWAVNSDKWICALTQSVRGMNMQLLVNWVDHQAVAMPHGPDVSPATCGLENTERNCEAGDLWVAGGPQGDYYENTDGLWVNVADGHVVDPAQVRVSTPRAPMAGTSQVRVYTLQGKHLGTWSRERIGVSTLPTGSYILRPVSGQRQTVVRVEMGL